MFARRLEILLLRGQTAAAMRALQGFAGWCDPSPVSLASPVAAVLPVRIANILAAHGYETLESVHQASDKELLAVSGRVIGYVALRTIRAACEAATMGRRLEHHVAKQAPDLLPDWEIDWEYLATVSLHDQKEIFNTCSCSKTKEKPSTMTNTVTSQLETFENLLANADTAVADIDKRIQQLQENIARLKRMRDVLAPPAAKTNRESIRNDTDISEYVERMRTALAHHGGPVTCKELGELTGIPYTMIGKYSDRSPTVFKKLGRLIDLQE